MHACNKLPSEAKHTSHLHTGVDDKRVNATVAGLEQGDLPAFCACPILRCCFPNVVYSRRLRGVPVAEPLLTPLHLLEKESQEKSNCVFLDVHAG